MEKRTRKRERELASKSTMIRKKFQVVFCKALLICFFAVVVIGGCSAFGIISGIIASAPSIEDINATPTGYLTTVLSTPRAIRRLRSLLRALTENMSRSTKSQRICSMHSWRLRTSAFTRQGIDIQGILRAGIKGIASGFHFKEGASTITQQLLKNTVFTDWVSEESLADKFERKFQEQYLALA